MSHDHNHLPSEIRHEKPLWWALGLTTTYLVVGWCKKNKTQVRSTIVELSDDECDSLADSLTTNGEAIKAKYGIDKKAVEAGATTGK